MTTKHRKRFPGSRKNTPANPGEDSQENQAGSAARWFVLGMIIAGLACVLAGCLRRGFEWRSVLTAAGWLVTGIGFVAIGLLELEWLERIIGFVDSLFSGLVQWLWTSWSGGLSESELVGRRGATVIWVVIGVPIFVWGCVVALRIVAL